MSILLCNNICCSQNQGSRLHIRNNKTTHLIAFALEAHLLTPPSSLHALDALFAANVHFSKAKHTEAGAPREGEGFVYLFSNTGLSTHNNNTHGTCRFGDANRGLFSQESKRLVSAIVNHTNCCVEFYNFFLLLHHRSTLNRGDYQCNKSIHHLLSLSLSHE